MTSQISRYSLFFKTIWQRDSTDFIAQPNPAFLVMLWSYVSTSIHCTGHKLSSYEVHEENQQFQPFFNFLFCDWCMSSRIVMALSVHVILLVLSVDMKFIQVTSLVMWNSSKSLAYINFLTWSITIFVYFAFLLWQLTLTGSEIIPPFSSAPWLIFRALHNIWTSPVTWIKFELLYKILMITRFRSLGPEGPNKVWLLIRLTLNAVLELSVTSEVFTFPPTVGKSVVPDCSAVQNHFENFVWHQYPMESTSNKFDVEINGEKRKESRLW